MAASVKITRKMTRKDGKAKATVQTKTSVSTSPAKVKVSASKKVVPKVNSVKSN